MLITNLKLQNFRNYEQLNIDFNKGINIIYGDNAQGKTNILEAIFVSSLGKSFRTNKEKELIKMGELFSKIEVDFSKSDRDGKIKIEISDKKNILVNGVKIKKLSELLGIIHIVIFTPDDINILNASLLAMKRAVSKLSVSPDVILVDGNKTFEIRLNDRGFQVGDIVVLKEWDNIKFSGREKRGVIKYILDDKFIGLAKGYVAFSVNWLEDGIPHWHG